MCFNNRLAYLQYKFLHLLLGTNSGRKRCLKWKSDRQMLLAFAQQWCDRFVSVLDEDWRRWAATTCVTALTTDDIASLINWVRFIGDGRHVPICCKAAVPATCVQYGSSSQRHDYWPISSLLFFFIVKRCTLCNGKRYGLPCVTYGWLYASVSPGHLSLQAQSVLARQSLLPDTNVTTASHRYE